MSQATFLGGLENLQPDAQIRLYIIDASAFGGPVYHFHGHDFGLTQEDIADAIAAGNPPPFKSLYYLRDNNGQPIEFSYWPGAAEGLGHDATGPSKNPTLTVGNLDGVVSSMCRKFSGMAQSFVSIIDTEKRFLDPKTFNATSPAQDPLANFTQVYMISRPSVMNETQVTFELMSPLDFNDLKLPTRQVTQVCTFAMWGDYRGEGCQYSGAAMFDEKDQPTTDPSKDKCAGLFVSCKIRFGENNDLNFGGCPTAGLVNR